MADKKKYAVIRTDLLAGTDNYADLVSFKLYDSDTPKEVENGVIVELESLVEGEGELWKAKLATESSDLNNCAIAAGVELIYDSDRYHNLSDYINEADQAVRGFIPRSRNIFSLTDEGFVESQAPSQGDEVGIGEGGKLDKSKTGFGKCIAVETQGSYTWRVIQIGKTESTASAPVI